MDQGLINLLLGLAIPATSILTLLLEKHFSRKKNNAEYGNEILELATNTAKSLKEAREELEAVKEQFDKIEGEHEREIEALRKDYKEKTDLLRGRIRDLERNIIQYEISFTMQTHPNVQIHDLKVVGKADPTDTQKIRAMQSGK